MGTENEPRDEPAAWDRVGWMLQDMGGMATNMSNRNLALWNAVSENLRRGDYTADAMAKDTARAMTTALDNMDDVWSFLTRLPQRDRVATGLPTAFLLIRWAQDDRATYMLPDPVSIVVPGAKTADLPDQAEIGLTGPDEQQAEIVRARLRATREESRPAYRLEARDVQGLSPGMYEGVVYLTDPPQALASLRIVVESPEA
jgi:hypothetical protein